MTDAKKNERARVSVMFRTDKNGKAYPTATNVYMALRNHDSWLRVLRHNELTETDEYHITDGRDPLGIEVRPVTPVSDEIAFHIRCWLEVSVQWTRPPAKDLVFDAIAAVAKKHQYHPVRDYLAPLAAEWDGTERIAHWLTDFCGAPDTPYVRAVARKTLIGAARRAVEPGCKLDTMLVLVGRQGVKKSTLIKTLSRGWFTDTPIEIGSKDGYENIRGAWFVEFAELAGMTGRDVERLKAFFSSPIDTYRPPYGRKPIVRLRTCVFIGSTNDTDFLKDATGSRRFWCVTVDDIDIDALEGVVDKLWAEATLCALRGDAYWLTDREADDAAQEAEAFTAVDTWEERIRDEIERRALTKFHTVDVYEWLDVPIKDQHAGTAQRINRIVSGRLGWHRPKEAFLHGTKRARGYVAPPQNAQTRNNEGQDTDGSVDPETQ